MEKTSWHSSPNPKKELTLPVSWGRIWTWKNIGPTLIPSRKPTYPTLRKGTSSSTQTCLEKGDMLVFWENKNIQIVGEVEESHICWARVFSSKLHPTRVSRGKFRKGPNPPLTWCECLCFVQMGVSKNRGTPKMDGL